ncbi:hypothetical protein PM3016_5470 [Paenibacillus mucilaginosus 3016]|uniref:Uncharacterized protein n=1 Tax=Paenibacillus mucilaginosus 3016 TaxID=1116391 RepID=H6NG43_9BACL|nr:hypothetical protein PM3016_5470 [Paenibacillus mucilaginosus 3016]
MNMHNETPLMKSMIHQSLWALMESDPARFKQEVKSYFARTYPGFIVVRAKYPLIYLRDDRRRTL